MITNNVNSSSILRALDAGTNPPVVNVVMANDMESSRLTCPKIKINHATNTVYTVKIIQIVESNCLNLKTPLPKNCFIPANFVSG